MDIAKRMARFPFLPLMIAASLLIGWFVPDFYDWTGADQSRPSPVVGPIALAIFVGGLIFCASLPWIPLDKHNDDADRQSRFRFGTRTLLAMTTGIAVVFALTLKFPIIGSGCVYVGVLGYLIRFWVLHRQHRMQTVALLCCMSSPFLWIVDHDELSNLIPQALMIAAGFPALIPTMLISSIVSAHPQEMGWLAVLLTSLELALGIWMIRLGPRRTLAYLVAVLILSTFASFIFNALVRI